METGTDIAYTYWGTGEDRQFAALYIYMINGKLYVNHAPAANTNLA